MTIFDLLIFFFFSGVNRKGHCHLIGYQPQNFRSQNLVKEPQIRKSAEHSTNPQNELPSYQQVNGMVPEHRNTLSLNQTIVGLDVTDMQDLSREQLVSCDIICRILYLSDV